MKRGVATKLYSPHFSHTRFRSGRIGEWRWVTLLPFLLVACKGDPNAPSVALFEGVITADKLATQEVCPFVRLGVNHLPTQYQLGASEDSFFKEYRNLQSLGYVTIKQIVAKVPYGSFDAWDVQMTPKWTKTFGSTADGPRCIGEWKAERVKEFTVPTEFAGVKMSAVTVEGQQKYVGWATDSKLRALFKVGELPPQLERTYTLVLKNTGWQVAAVND